MLSLALSTAAVIRLVLVWGRSAVSRGLSGALWPRIESHLSAREGVSVEGVPEIVRFFERPDLVERGPGGVELGAVNVRHTALMLGGSADE